MGKPKLQAVQTNQYSVLAFYVFSHKMVRPLLDLVRWVWGSHGLQRRSTESVTVSYFRDMIAPPRSPDRFTFLL